MPGLVAEYANGAKTVQRTDADVLFDWQDKSPDMRLPAGPFTVRWQGQLLVLKDDSYQLHLYVGGKVRISIDGKTLLAAEERQPAWQRSPSIPLGYGYHPLLIEYERTGPAGRVGLYWQSPQFDLEPIPARQLVHSPPAIAQPDPVLGQSLVRAYRCAACHSLPMAGEAVRAPSLAKINGAVYPAWLERYVQHPAEGKAHAAMPDFGLTVAEARAVTAALWSQGKPVALGKPAAGNSARGRRLAETVGCLACHMIGATGRATLFGGGDLTRIAAKRPPAFFARWLRAPADLNEEHRMPVFELSGKEIGHLSAYLATLGHPPMSSENQSLPDLTLAAAGRNLMAAKGCANCHAVAGVRPKAPLEWRPPSIAPGHGPNCLGAPVGAKNQPGYSFDAVQQAAIRAFLDALPAEPARVSPAVLGQQVLAQNNCTRCHPRGTGNGLRDIVTTLGVTDTKAQASRVPPSLNAAGDKFERPWLAKAVTGTAKRLRPWLGPRMPRFRHTPEETAALTDFLIGHDRLPGPDDQPRITAPSGPLLLAAQRLVGGAGFGCMSCHAIGSYEPVNVEPGARGADLRFPQDRLRYSWFRRWTRDPARIAPGVEMPAINLASPGVLDGKIASQLEALWYGLNAPRLDLPTANAVQLVRVPPGGRAAVIRDLFHLEKTVEVPRPFAVGLANGQNLLIDLDRFRLRQWWLGDCARQRTQGKSWFWEPAGANLLDQPDNRCLLALRANANQLGADATSAAGPEPAARLVEAELTGQSVGRLTAYEHLPAGVRLFYELHFPGDRWIPVQLTITADSSAARLEVSATNVPAGFAPVLRPSASAPAGESGGLAFATPFGRATIAAAGTGSANRFVHAGNAANGCWILPLVPVGKVWQAAVQLETAVAAPVPAPYVPTGAGTLESKPLPVLPGYEVLRLAVDDGPMPTAMAFRKDGALVVASLKGGVFLLRDTNGDGLLDTYSLFSDQLAAPYGLLTDGDDVIISHKPELLRLRDLDHDGRADRAEVLASGWGVTGDYHDWAVGLVRDHAGAIYVLLPCQQDDRPLAAAKFRGKLVRVTQDGRVEEICGGLRFAMGMAANDRGDLFATDNQGVTNPFNELNHLRPGRHYGFWNKLEPHRPGQVVTPPAIQIPHPWTRSVNGIAFVPPTIAFGPFAGQLIGADYTTRRLIRLSLQRVGETYQGCAYPFSEADRKAIERDETFLGPVSLAFGPDGCLYVGSMIDSGWGGGNNRGAIERVRFVGPVPFGIREVRSHARGFALDLTGPVDPERAADPRQYAISSYRRIPRGGYETPDQDRATAVVEQVRVSADRRSVTLFLKSLRSGYVYDLAIGPIHGRTDRVYPAVAYYTLNEIPRERAE